MKLVNWLEGKKVFLGWAAVVVYGLLTYFGVVPSNNLVWGFIATWTGVSYRLAISKS